MSDIWFWYYEIKFWDELEEGYKYPSGLVTGSTIVDAMQNLYKEYGEGIEDIQTLRALTENVFEFDSTKYLDNFNWTISPV